MSVVEGGVRGLLALTHGVVMMMGMSRRLRA